MGDRRFGGLLKSIYIYIVNQTQRDLGKSLTAQLLGFVRQDRRGPDMDKMFMNTYTNCNMSHSKNLPVHVYDVLVI